MPRPTHTHLVWDFNGTILDDVRLGIDSVNPMLASRGLPTLTTETYRAHFGFPVKDYYRHLGFDFDRDDYDTVLAPEWVANYRAGERDCPLVPGVRDTLDAVATRDVHQIMLSASHRAQLLEQLAYHGLSNAFEEIIALDNIHAGGKVALAVAWKDRHPDAHPLFVGDTEHDAEVARAVGADCVLFTGGHQSRDRLAACACPLIDRLEDILAYL